MNKAYGRVKAAHANKPAIMAKADDERAKRLAEALRANLRRRKAAGYEVEPLPAEFPPCRATEPD